MFQKDFPNSNESTACTSRQKYEFELSEAKRIWRVVSASICRIQVQRPLLFGEIDGMVQRYLVAANNRGAVISKAVAISTAKVLMSRFPHLVGSIDIGWSHLAQSLFRKMGFVLQGATTTIPEIPEGAVKKQLPYFTLKLFLKKRSFIFLNP